MTTPNPDQTKTSTESTGGKSARLHYLDWLQVLAILGVFLFHTVRPFDDLFPWHIKNAEASIFVNFFVGFFNLWGMPFFFLMAGATSWFSLRRRSASRYVRERVTRLLIPFIVGSILLTPIQAYYELTHIGWWKGGSIVEFILSSEARTFFYTEFHPISLSTGIFGAVGYHLWFVGYLFAFALIALPIFLWLNQEPGKRFAGYLEQLAKWRGGLLAFVIPLALIRFFLQSGLTGLWSEWSGFIYTLLFFVSGYIIISNEQFRKAIRRDRWLHLILSIACTLFFFADAFGVPVSEWMGSSGTLGFYLSWILFGINSWCWTMFIFYIGMRYLDFSNDRLQYAREATYPFFFLHQPVIIFIAFYAVQWNVNLLIKLSVVVIGSFAGSLGLYELLVKRIAPVRMLFGMKPKL